MNSNDSVINLDNENIKYVLFFYESSPSRPLIFLHVSFGLMLSKIMDPARNVFAGHFWRVGTDKI